MIWDTELKFAGSIDMIYRNPDGSLDIYDWKRSVKVLKKRINGNLQPHLVLNIYKIVIIGIIAYN